MTESLPGVTIQQIFRSSTGTERDFPRYTGIVAKTSNQKLFSNAPIVRGFVPGEPLSFNPLTFIAELGLEVLPVQSRARLYTSGGTTITPSRWKFVGTTGIQIDPALFSATTTYLLDYITTDPTYEDLLPVQNLRETLLMGDLPGQVKYVEDVDYRFVTTTTNPPTAGASNAFPSAVLTAVANGLNVSGAAHSSTQSFALSGTYTGLYNRAYTVRCTTGGTVGSAGNAVFVCEAIPTSSGHTSDLPRTTSQGNAIPITVAMGAITTITVSLELGISAVFALSGTQTFIVGDTWTFQANGAGLLELSDQMQSTSQFATTSAVTQTVGSGHGIVTVDPQSVFTGNFNQSYELEVTAASAGVSATFTSRARPLLLDLTGTVTATHLSATVTGAGTKFVSELAVGDQLFIGTDTAPVVVASITDDLTLVLATLAGASTPTYKPTTQTAVKALRVRSVTSSFVIQKTASQRVVFQDGIFLDYNFATDFVVGDKYAFTAAVPRLTYNGKEDRDYTLTVTAVSTPDQITVTYSGSTNAAGFGSQVFSEGAPLVLPNNLVIFARNLSLGSRYSISSGSPPAPDKFTLSATFDGLIDWDLQKPQTVTVPSTQIQRDITGNVTGVPGAFFVTTRQPYLSVQFVAASATNANIAFNSTAGTNVVWFTTDPGVNLTVAYRTAGLEPTAGNSYFLTGYQLRPASDFDSPQLFFNRQSARQFLAPQSVTNDAAIANEIAWDQDEANLAGVVFFLVQDSNGDGIYTPNDYQTAIRVSEQFTDNLDIVVVNEFDVQDEAWASDINQNDPSVGHQRISYTGFPIDYPIGDALTPDTRIYTAQREMVVNPNTPAKGTLVAFGNASCSKIIQVDSLGDGNAAQIPTEVVLDGSFAAVALASLVSSRPDPWNPVYGLFLSGFTSMERLSLSDMTRLQAAGIICAKVDGPVMVIATKDVSPDTTEPSTHFVHGTTQRQYVTSRMKDGVQKKIIGMTPNSPTDGADQTKAEAVQVLGNLLTEQKIGQYTNADGSVRALNPDTDVSAFISPSNPTKVFFAYAFNNRYAIYEAAGVFAVDAPRP